MEPVKCHVPEEIADAIEERLEYGDSKSAWVRDAVRMRLAIESDSDDGATVDAE
jgi:Arc/MetJ-type ribon-helix-helix transcriptional regulator